jgi:hypothetical protein
MYLSQTYFSGERPLIVHLSACDSTHPIVRLGYSSYQRGNGGESHLGRHDPFGRLLLSNGAHGRDGREGGKDRVRRFRPTPRAAVRGGEDTLREREDRAAASLLSWKYYALVYIRKGRRDGSLS